MSKYTEEEWVALNNRTMKQTAVDWLESKLNEFEFDDALYIANNRGWFKQAKEMERKQIIDTFEMGRFNIDDMGNGEEYYNETYGSKGNDDTSSQTEISDEEIFKQSIKEMEERYGSGCDEEIDAHFRGAIWYREQLKQNNLKLK